MSGISNRILLTKLKLKHYLGTIAWGRRGCDSSFYVTTYLHKMAHLRQRHHNKQVKPTRGGAAALTTVNERPFLITRTLPS